MGCGEQDEGIARIDVSRDVLDDPFQTCRCRVLVECHPDDHWSIEARARCLQGPSGENATTSPSTSATCDTISTGGLDSRASLPADVAMTVIRYRTHSHTIKPHAWHCVTLSNQLTREQRGSKARSKSRIVQVVESNTRTIVGGARSDGQADDLEDFRRLSAGRAERDAMDSATIKLRRALTEAGFDPR
jgi:hypothetical protein